MTRPEELLSRVTSGFGQGIEGTIEKDAVAVRVPAALIARFATFVRDVVRFDMISAITAVDNGDSFEVLYHWVTIGPMAGRFPGYLLARVTVPRQAAVAGAPVEPGSDDDEPTIPSITSVYPGANQQEREIYDLMGIRFRGHPKLERILLWEGFPGHPLRKDWRPLNAEIPWHLAGLNGFGGDTMQDAPAIARVADDGTGYGQPIRMGTTPEAFQYPANRAARPGEALRIRIGQGGLIDGEAAAGPGRIDPAEDPGDD